MYLYKDHIVVEERKCRVFYVDMTCANELYERSSHDE